MTVPSSAVIYGASLDLVCALQIQFHMKGPSGTGLVNADMYKDEQQQWQYTYLLVDVYAGTSRQPQRVHIVVPR